MAIVLSCIMKDSANFHTKIFQISTTDTSITVFYRLRFHAGRQFKRDMPRKHTNVKMLKYSSIDSKLFWSTTYCILYTIRCWTLVPGSQQHSVEILSELSTRTRTPVLQSCGKVNVIVFLVMCLLFTLHKETNLQYINIKIKQNFLICLKGTVSRDRNVQKSHGLLVNGYADMQIFL